MTQASPAAQFIFRIDNAATTLGSPTDDGQNYQQLWGSSTNWTYVSGTDDGIVGIPDGADTFTINRTGNTGGSTRLTEESAPGGLVSVAGITGTGAGGTPDIILKLRDFTIGDLNLLASAFAFQIQEERDKSLTINGVISGSGSLLLSRAGGFSDGVGTNELITLTGSSPNTISGSIFLSNTNGSGQPCYFVADKVGAFGQASAVTLQGASGSGTTSLRITSNTIGGGGAFDDSVTSLLIGRNGVLEVDSGVDEKFGEGLLSIDLTGSGNPTIIQPGTYDSSVAWITGGGTVTVVPEPSCSVLGALGLLCILRRKR